MVKPIGNRVINRPPKDKVSYHTAQRFSSPSPLHSNSSSTPTPPAPKTPKYKTRKK